MAPQMIHRYFNKESTAVRMLDRNRVLFVLLLAIVGAISTLHRPTYAQDIWEYSPYRVQVWVAIDPQLTLEPKAQERLMIDIERQLELTFGAAWSSKVILKQGALQTQLLHDTEHLTTAALESSDLVVVVPKKNEKTDTIRSIDALAEKATEIAVPQELLPQLTENLGRYPKDALLTSILGKLKSTTSSASQLKSEISEEKTLVGLMPRQEIHALTTAQESSELVAILPKNNDRTDTIRSMEALLEKATEIAVPQESFRQLKQNLERYPKDALLKGILGKLKSTISTVSQLKSEISEGKTLVAFLPRQEVSSLGENIRSLTLRFPWQGENIRSVALRFPWQMDSIFKDNDKIFFVAVRLVDGKLELAVREFDCPTRWFSPTHKTFPSYNPAQLGTPICRSIIQVFAPIARLEESTAKEAKLLGRAFGLITSEENPAMLRQGDVLQPIIRRDDRNGLPTLLEAVPWTYVAVTDIKNELITAAVFSGIRGGLEGRRNKRTQRVALKVRPSYPHTDLKLGTVGDDSMPLTGTEVYFKQPGGDDLALLGRTDWRGIYRVAPPKERVSLTIKPPPPPPPPAPATPPASSAGTDKAGTDKASADKAAADQATADGDARGPVKQDSVETAIPLPSGDTSSNASASAQGTPENAPTGETRVIPLNHPLIILYIKNGDTVLARLPIVVGVDKLASADTPNDLRRLEAEGFLRGLQSEIIDVVAARQIMAARIRMRLKENKVNDATELLDQLRLQRNYKVLVAELDEMEKSLKSPDREPMPPTVAVKVARMFIQTRELVQKYLQDKLDEQLRQEIEDVKQGKVPGETPPPANAAASTPAPAPSAPSNPPPAAPSAPSTPPPANNSSSGKAPPPPVGSTPNNSGNSSNGGMREPMQPSSVDG